MKIGIVVDNYKVSTYIDRLQKDGLTYECHPWKHNCTQITVTTEVANAKEVVHSICEQLEAFFYARRN